MPENQAIEEHERVTAIQNQVRAEKLARLQQ